MSAGDVDDTLGSEAELQSLLRENRALGDYLKGATELPILRGNDIPFGAGISTDGQRRYIDRHLHTRFRGLDISQALATHESTEWGLRKFAQIGVDYPKDPSGHRLANRAEFIALARIFQSSADEGLWRDYSNFIDPQVKRDEKENIEEPPQDLALYPYTGSMRAHLIRKGVENEADRGGSEVGEGDSGRSEPVAGNAPVSRRPNSRRDVKSPLRRTPKEKR